MNSDPGVPLKQIYAAAPPEVADALWPRLDGYEKVKAKEVARVTAGRRQPAGARGALHDPRWSPRRAAPRPLTLLWGDKGWTTSVKPAM